MVYMDPQYMHAACSYNKLDTGAPCQLQVASFTVQGWVKQSISGGVAHLIYEFTMQIVWPQNKTLLAWHYKVI